MNKIHKIIIMFAITLIASVYLLNAQEIKVYTYDKYGIRSIFPEYTIQKNDINNTYDVYKNNYGVKEIVPIQRIYNNFGIENYFNEIRIYDNPLYISPYQPNFNNNLNLNNWPFYYPYLE